MPEGSKTRPALVPVVREDLGGQVYAQLAQAIAENELKPGERLVEDDLAASLGVSRAPVRDALLALERDGLVESSRSRRGKFVSTVSAKDAAEVYSLRAALEGMACYLAAPAVTQDEIDELLAIAERMRRYTGPTDIKKLSDLDTQFHERLCVISGNQRLIDDWRRMYRQIRFLSRTVINTLYQDHLDAVAGRHEHIAKLLAAHDPKAAENAVRDHIESVANRITGALRDLEAGQATDGTDAVGADGPEPGGGR